MFDGYEEGLWHGVIHAAEALDVDLLAVLGGALEDPPRQPSVFELAGAGSVDGVIALSPSIGFLCGPTGVATVLGRLGGVPAISVSERIPGVPAIVVDNRTGMNAVVEHLATAHGRRRIAFVKGPPSSTEAGVRFEAYRDTLAKVGLPYDPALVVDGDHWPASGVRAVRALLDDRRVSFDALVSSNDIMAIAAMDELRRRGLRVPDDVAVAGFDDVIDAASTDPPLTTARQPLHEMGREAVRRVLALARGEPVSAIVELPAQLSVRQSCGCPGLEGGAALPASAAGRAVPPGGIAARLAAAFPELGARLGVAGWAEELGDALPPPSGRGSPRAFLQALEGLLARGLRALPEPAPWFRVLRQILVEVTRAATAEEAAQVAVLLGTAHAVVGSMAASAELARRMRTDLEARVLHRMIQPFPLPDDAFIRSLLAALDVLDVRSFFLSRYLDPELREALLLVHHDLDGVVELEAPLNPFAAHRLVPGTFTGRARRAHALLPIRSPEGPIGVALCEIGAMSGAGYEMLMHQISVVLSVNGLMAAVQDQHRQLLETARQAGMAEVAVGALHNVGNLLNSVSVSADEIQAAAAAAAGSGLSRAAALLGEQGGDLAGFLSRDPRAPLLCEYLPRAIEALGKELERLQGEARELVEKTGLVKDSIRALQDHARGGGEHLVREAVELPTVVRAALEIQHAHLARWGVQVRQELDGLPPLFVPRSKLVHVLVNLVKNAVEAMRATPEGRRELRVRAARQPDGKVRLEVADSGEGIAEGDLERIFTYGFTTKRDGHGFGLHTCASYLKQMGGSISVASDGEGRGATFTLLLDPGAG